MGEQQIEVATPAARGTFDQLNIFGAKDDAAEHAEEFGHFANRAAVDAELSLLWGPIKFDFVIARVLCFSSNKEAGLTVSNHLRAGDAAEGTKGGEKIDRFEDVGLTLCIVAEQQVEAGRELDIEPPVIPKIP